VDIFSGEFEFKNQVLKKQSTGKFAIKIRETGHKLKKWKAKTAYY